MYKKGAGNDKQGKDVGNRTLCPYRNFSQAIMNNKMLIKHPYCSLWIKLHTRSELALNNRSLLTKKYFNILQVCTQFDNKLLGCFRKGTKRCNSGYAYGQCVLLFLMRVPHILACGYTDWLQLRRRLATRVLIVAMTFMMDATKDSYYFKS